MIEEKYYKGRTRLLRYEEAKNEIENCVLNEVLEESKNQALLVLEQLVYKFNYEKQLEIDITVDVSTFDFIIHTVDDFYNVYLISEVGFELFVYAFGIKTEGKGYKSPLVSRMGGSVRD